MSYQINLHTHSIFHWMTSVQREQQLVTTTLCAFLALSSDFLNRVASHLVLLECFWERWRTADWVLIVAACLRGRKKYVLLETLFENRYMGGR